MNQPVLLKGNSLGLTMVLDPGMKFDQLIKAIEDKFVQAKDFFNGQTQIALKIEGRKLDAKELQNVLQVIAEKTTLTIAYVIEDDKIMETSFKDVLKKIQEREQKRSQSMVDERRKGDGQFYRGTLRSGQSLESDASVIDVMEMITLLSQHLICSRCRSVSENTSQEVPMENQRRRKSFSEDQRIMTISRWKHRLHL